MRRDQKVMGALVGGIAGRCLTTGHRPPPSARGVASTLTLTRSLLPLPQVLNSKTPSMDFLSICAKRSCRLFIKQVRTLFAKRLGCL